MEGRREERGRKSGRFIHPDAKAAFAAHSIPAAKQKFADALAVA